MRAGGARRYRGAAHAVCRPGLVESGRFETWQRMYKGRFNACSSSGALSLSHTYLEASRLERVGRPVTLGDDPCITPATALQLD